MGCTSITANRQAHSAKPYLRVLHDEEAVNNQHHESGYNAVFFFFFFFQKSQEQSLFDLYAKHNSPTCKSGSRSGGSTWIDSGSETPLQVVQRMYILQVCFWFFLRFAIRGRRARAFLLDRLVYKAERSVGIHFFGLGFHHPAWRGLDTVYGYFGDINDLGR